MSTDSYTAYGLHIRSELALHFPPADPAMAATAADVTVRLGAAPAALPAPADSLGFWQTAPGAFLLDVQGVARYLVSDGRDILVDPSPQAGDRDLGVFLAGSAMGALLQQRGVTTLHASAIRTEGGAAFFLGHSGAGKSTLAAAMQRRGYALLADDVTALSWDTGGRPQVLSAAPGVKLWADALKALSLDGRERERIRDGIEKYRVSPGGFCAAPQRPCAAFVLGGHNRDEFETTTLGRRDACRVLTTFTYRPRYRRGLGQTLSHFRMTTALAKQTPTIRVTRPSDLSRIEMLADRIETALQAPEQAVAG